MSTSEAVRVFGSTLAGQPPAPRISSSSSKPRGCSSRSHEAAVLAGGDQAQRDRSCLYVKLGLQKNQEGHVLQIVFLPILFPQAVNLRCWLASFPSITRKLCTDSGANSSHRAGFRVQGGVICASNWLRHHLETVGALLPTGNSGSI